MRSLLSGITIFLSFLSKYVQAAAEEGPGGPPSETVDVIWVLVFVFIFFGMIAYYSWHIIKAERKRRLQDKVPE